MVSNSVVLCILDGWGNGNNNKYDAIGTTYKPFWNNIISQYPRSNLITSGVDVGLPEGQIGNSEVGHINLGSGRIILQDLHRINTEIHNIQQNSNLLSFINKIKSKKSACHIIGLLSDGGVHSLQSHMLTLITVLATSHIKVFIHAFLDGRDTLPSSAKKYINILNEHIRQYNNVYIATISGRYYAMDRDNRLDRTEKAYNAIAFSQGEKYNDAILAINSYYASGITDEFIPPSIISNYCGLNPDDGILITNFRSDRIIQIINMITNHIKPSKHIHISNILGMIQYSKNINIPCLFPKHNIQNTLGEIISNHNLFQLRLAETEKFAHVTFFFNGGREELFKNEERIIIPSPKVLTYDLKPEMSAYEVTDHLISSINLKKYSLIIVNYANADMVGHTGNIEATRKAIATIDICLGKILKSIKKNNYILVITADHGNAEEMFDSANKMPYTAHTTNSVPFIICNYNKKITLKNGRLCDVSPTILELLQIKQPIEMTGESLIQKM
ncbi:2,3-bisphosphoglycerate-independent phosphoglycerate mutase [Neoehrlichia mikurensis]|uniref:2,3-bisphosphoglycerate-independent phosphoglycerate mutase n=1 Tax=Neoehrlichia mikurensis TaxID=89586 RepID=A0ABY5EXM5_9RICK|nr:2,3-bisphosphoglycerate-independent phosphoglycerate mutase [Neoehrlichia mikurensis]QXK91870.1 2,3-bisphosphoglycerate-independent phosphoglycerate mutase [Neoehrlichia mikurensis]QXK93083.1 2,3-bisphosphoglycerate-independent phosphoglycerate mutase [Neoehrlichia mikurensis]QXK93563.1 2,3-bisphosphoglycerate-independent phosphoglycerate mutase [Neoehrlichia mikurensis]UTO56404.1 2,3-bisphosphoglycerate-independent phosphoglycerate mutase [Neoehrlichia mikurensis]